jgi:hypothetical protein
MLPIDGSKSCQISWARRFRCLIYSAYYCRPYEPSIEGGQYAHDVFHTEADAGHVRHGSGRTIA